MSVIGFPGFSNVLNATVRAPVNPMDKSTIFSIYPKNICEVKHTTQPCVYEIKAGTAEKPSRLVVGPASWWRRVDENQPLLEITNGSVQVADDIVKSYCNGILGCNMQDSMPGLFWVPGDLTIAETIKTFPNAFPDAIAKQKRFFEALIKLADTGWARTNGNPLAISDDSRLAAMQLQLKEKPWMRDNLTYEKVNCRFCGTLLTPGFPVCPVCHGVVDPAKAKELGYMIAEPTKVEMVK